MLTKLSLAASLLGISRYFERSTKTALKISPACKAIRMAVAPGGRCIPSKIVCVSRSIIYFAKNSPVVAKWDVSFELVQVFGGNIVTGRNFCNICPSCHARQTFQSSNAPSPSSPCPSFPFPRPPTPSVTSLALHNAPVPQVQRTLRRSLNIGGSANMHLCSSICQFRFRCANFQIDYPPSKKKSASDLVKLTSNRGWTLSDSQTENEHVGSKTPCLPQVHSNMISISFLYFLTPVV